MNDPRQSDEQPTVAEPRLSGAGSPAAEAAQPQELGRGVALSRYVLLERIGEGGMGEVWSAYDPELDRRVALKLLRTDRAAGAPTRLLREAQALARLAHPNVLTVHDVGTWGQRVFVATELVAGESLDQWLEERPRSWREVRDAFVAAGHGLEAAHRSGLVHRDFKLHNVVVGREGAVKVIDFGLARAQEADDEDEVAHDEATTVELPPVPAQRLLDTPLTAVGSVSGTLPYMAPEQLMGARPDARSDQFSFCVALYEALWGRRPFDGPTPQALVHAIATGEPASPPARPRVPRFLARAVFRGLSRRREDRFPTMGELLGALSRDPSRTWSRRIAAGGALLLLGVAAVAGVLSMRERAQLCRGGERQLAGVWDDARREATRRSFHATGLPFADEAWRLAAAGLDGYTTGWVAMHRDACEATRLRGEQSARLLDLRMACLQERREQVRGLADAFLEPDKKVVQNATAAVEGLSALGDCADVRSLTGLPPPPPRDRRRVEVLRAELARAKSLTDVGRYPEAAAAADRVVAAATAVAYQPLLAEALTRRGKAQNLAGTEGPARASLVEAAWTGEACRHDHVVAIASTDLVRLIGYEQQDRAGAETWIRLARAVVERNGSPPAWSSELHEGLGLTALAAGQFDEAVKQLRTTLAMEQRHRLPPLDRAGTLTSLGGALVYSGHAAEALPHFREALDIRRRVQGELHPQVAAATNNLGAVALAVGDYAAGVELIERGLELKRRLLGADNPELATSVNNLAEGLRLAGRYDEAEPHYREAMRLWARAHGEDHPYYAEGLDGLGALENDRGRPAAALLDHRRARAIREARLGASHPRLAYSLTGEGKALVALGRAREAVVPLERALSLREAGGAEDGELAETRFALARALAGAGGDARRARALAEQAAAGYAKTGARFPRQRAEVERWLNEHRPPAAAPRPTAPRRSPPR